MVIVLLRNGAPYYHKYRFRSGCTRKHFSYLNLKQHVNPSPKSVEEFALY